MAYPHIPRGAMFLAHLGAVKEEAVRAHLLDAHGIFFDGEPTQSTMRGVHYVAHEVDERMGSFTTPSLPQMEEQQTLVKTRRRRVSLKKKAG